MSSIANFYTRLKQHPYWPKNLAGHAVIGPYWRLMRIDKPIGTLLLLWPAMASLWIAGEGNPDISLVIIFLLGTFLMRSAGCAINDYADRGLDGQVKRTSHRPLATGELTPKKALICFISLCLISLFLVLLTNRLTIYLAFVGAILTAVYPFLKRITHLPQVWLGLAMNWGIMMAYSAQTGTISEGIVIFYLATVLWCVAYDCFYAMVDREDDIRMNAKSIAILFGEQDKLFCGILQFLCLMTLYTAGNELELGIFFNLITIGGSAGFFIYQQYLIRNREPENCFKAFMNNSWVALLLFLGVAIDLMI